MISMILKTAQNQVTLIYKAKGNLILEVYLAHTHARTRYFSIHFSTHVLGNSHI